MKNSTLLLLLFLFISSCGGDSGGGSDSLVEVKTPQERQDDIVPPQLEVPIPTSEIDQIMANQNFSCAPIDNGPCPDGVARLLILEGTTPSGYCSGFMLDRNTLITNHHCVPTQEVCNNTHVAVYDGEGQYFRTKCNRLVRTEEDFPIGDIRRSIDVSVLEIEGQFTGSTFNRSSERAADGESVSAWVVDHTGILTGNHTDSRITELSCTVLGPVTASLILENCPTIAGNSGSPALNSSGQVIGVVWGGTSQFNVEVPLDERRLRDESAAVTEMIYFFETPSNTTGGTTGETTGGTTGETTGGTTGETTGGTTGETTGGTTGQTTGGTTGQTTGGTTGQTTGTSGGTTGETTERFTY